MHFHFPYATPHPSTSSSLVMITEEMYSKQKNHGSSEDEEGEVIVEADKVVEPESAEENAANNQLSVQLNEEKFDEQVAMGRDPQLEEHEEHEHQGFTTGAPAASSSSSVYESVCTGNS
jgi:hypothetical protein